MLTILKAFFASIFVLSIAFFFPKTINAQVCANQLALDIFDCVTVDPPGLSDNYCWRYIAYSDFKDCSPSGGDCKTDESWCASSTPCNTVPNDSPCSPSSYTHCDSPSQQTSCQLGHITSCTNGSNCNGCAEARFDCWMPGTPPPTGGGGTPTPAPTPTPPPSCTVDLTPNSATLSPGAFTILTAIVTVGGGTVDRVNFTSSNNSIVTVNPLTDSTVVYSTQAQALFLGSATVSADVVMGGSVTCSDSVATGGGTTVNVALAGPWWQTRDADVTTNGDLVSLISGLCILPFCNPVLGLRGTGGFPGVVAYGGSTADFSDGGTRGNAAESPYNWLANSRYNGRIYDYAFFDRLIPDDVVINELTPPVTGGTFNSGGAPSRGYVWYHWNGTTLGDLTITGNVNLVGSRRVVLLVEDANATIDGRIQLQTPGQGFFMMVVGKDANGQKGDIIVDPSVDDIEGIYLAESEFSTGVANSQLQVRGSVVAYDGFNLQRDLGILNEISPAELFEYAPEIIATFPRVFTQRRIRWKEVAP